MFHKGAWARLVATALSGLFSVSMYILKWFLSFRHISDFTRTICRMIYIHQLNFKNHYIHTMLECENRLNGNLITTFWKTKKIPVEQKSSWRIMKINDKLLMLNIAIMNVHQMFPQLFANYITQNPTLLGASGTFRIQPPLIVISRPVYQRKKGGRRG